MNAIEDNFRLCDSNLSRPLRHLPIPGFSCLNSWTDLCNYVQINFTIQDTLYEIETLELLLWTVYQQCNSLLCSSFFLYYSVLWRCLDTQGQTPGFIDSVTKTLNSTMPCQYNHTSSVAPAVAVGNWDKRATTLSFSMCALTI